MKKQGMAQDIMDFNKNTVKMSFEVLGAFSEQAARTADQILGITPNVPDEGKRAVDSFFKENQKGLTNLKKCVETGMDIDWTSQNAPVKGLQVMEGFYSSACSQADAMQKETREIFKKASEQLPKEAKPLVEFWNEALSSNVQFFQNFVIKNFELAKKVMTDVAAEAPKAETKTATK